MRTPAPLLLACAFSLCLVGCAASSNPSRASSSRWREPEAAKTPAQAGSEAPAKEAGPAQGAAASQAPTELVIARIGERAVGVSQLLAAWMYANSDEVSATLERLVTAETVALEAGRLGLALDPGLVDEAYARAAGEIEAEIRRNDPEWGLDEYARYALGLDPEGYKRGLRRHVERQLVGHRLVRGFVLTSERANVRVIITDKESEIRAVSAELAAGRPFEELARERSVDPSGKRGGALPPLLRNQSALSRLAFLSGAGNVGGPIQESEGGRWLLLEVLSIEPPLEGTWQEIGPAVEASLEERPVQDAEYWQWKAAMTQRYKVDLDPFFRLVDEASK